MAKTGVTSNIPKAMKQFEASIKKLQAELISREESLAVIAMDSIREKGLVKGETDKKGYYADIKQAVPGIISYSKPLKRGGRSKVRKIFAKNRIAVRKSNLFDVFEHKTSFSKSAKGSVQTRKDAKITIEKFRDGKRIIRFDFYGASGRSLRLLSYGQKRTQTVTTAEGKELRGRKGRRDVVRNGIKRVFVGGHNKALQKYIDSDYAKDFRKIK